TVLGDVQVQRAQVDAAEIAQCLHHFGEVVARVGGGDAFLQFVRAVHDPTVQRNHVPGRAQVAPRVEAVQVAEQEARGVADAPVQVTAALEDLVGHRHLVAVVGGGDPQPQHVRAHRVDDLVR